MTLLSMLPSATQTASAPGITFLSRLNGWPARPPCRRFADILADICARLGVDAVRYSFIVVDLHHLLLAGLPAHPCENANALADFIRECEHRGRDVEAKSLGSRERR